MTDTNDIAPDAPPSADLAAEHLPGYEPPVPGESQREKRNRKARNRRLAERHAAANTTTAPTTGPGRPSKSAKRAEAVTAVVALVGVGVLPFDEHDGTVIIEGAGNLGQALAKVAEKNSKVAAALDSLSEVSAWGEVAMAVGAIAMPIIAHHATKRPKPEPVEPTPEPTPTAGTSSPATADTVPTFRAIHDDPPGADPVPTFAARQ